MSGTCTHCTRRFGTTVARGLLLTLGLLLAACSSQHDIPVAEPAPYSTLSTPDYGNRDRLSPEVETRLADRVLLLKSQRRLLLIADGRAFREYQVSLGFEPVGDKLREGDGRTPEGHYILDWKNSDSEYYRSIHISYPNTADRAQARATGIEDPGDNIMIHGLGPEMAFLGKTHRAADWTNGCIAVTNKEIDEIWRLVPTGTPIEIRP